MKIGYVRVSAEDQNLDLQLDALEKADLYTVSKLLGHTSLKTTEKYYVDLLDENYSSSVKELEDIFPTFTSEKSA